MSVAPSRAKKAAAPPVPINVYDAGAAKAAVDGALEHALHKRLPADHSLSNLRLALTALGTLLAVVAQFYPPGKYPANWAALVVCCPLYFAVSAAVTYWLPGREQDIVAVATAGARPLELRSALHTERAAYEARVTGRGGSPVLRSVTAPLAELFYANGVLNTDQTQRMAAQLFAADVVAPKSK